LRSGRRRRRQELITATTSTQTNDGTREIEHDLE
jgi:hypothetical protein